MRLAASHGLQGVMVWEAGQDCREAPVWRHGKAAEHPPALLLEPRSPPFPLDSPVRPPRPSCAKVAHVQTCPEQGPGVSLLSAIRGALPPSSEGAGLHDEL